MSGAGFNRSKRRDSGVIPFADENPFSTLKLNSIAEANNTNTENAQQRNLNRLRRPQPKMNDQLAPIASDNDSQQSTSTSSSTSKGSISDRRNVKIGNVHTHIAIAEDS